MPDNIFGVNVGQVQPPSGGRNVGGGLSSSAGASLNQLMRFQQRMYEIEQQKKMQETANKNALFGDLAKKIGVGAKDSKDFLGIEPMNMHQANLLAGIQKDIQDQMTALSNSDGSTKNYSQSVKNIKTILSSPDFLEAGITNQVIKGAIKGIEENKANVHPLWQDELAKFQNAQSSGEYDVRVLQNWKDYAVEKMDIENDLKAFDEKGISVKAIVSPISGQELLVTSQDNKDYIGRYFKGKYSKNFGLDYDRAVKNGDESIGAMTREDYINSQTSKLTDAFVTQEESQKMQNTGISKAEYDRRSGVDLKDSVEEARQKSQIEIKEAEEKSKIKVQERINIENSKRFAPDRSRGVKSLGSSGSGYKNPYTAAKPTHKDLFDKLNQQGLLSPENVNEVQDYIDGEIKANGVDKMTGEQRDVFKERILSDAAYKFAEPLSDYQIGEMQKQKYLPKDPNLKIDLRDGETVDLKDRKVKGKETFTNPIGFGGKDNSLDWDAKSRFIPKGLMPSGEYSGDYLTTDPKYKSETEITGSEANERLGEEVFKADDKVFIQEGKSDIEKFGYFSAPTGKISDIVGYMETDNNYDAKNPESSAYGRWQFTDTTGFALAKKLKLASTMDEYKEKVKAPEFQNALMAEQEKFITSRAKDVERILRSNKEIEEQAKATIAAALGKEKIEKIPSYFIPYLIHHQGSSEAAVKFLKNGKDLIAKGDLQSGDNAIADGNGLVKVLRKGFKKYGWGDYEEKAESGEENKSYIKQDKPINPARF